MPHAERLLPPIEGGKTFYIYKNGDRMYPAKRINFNKKQLPSFDSFLEEVTKTIKPRFGAVRQLYTPLGTRRVKDIEDLEKCGTTYVAAGHEKYVKLEYLKIDENFNTRQKSQNLQREIVPVKHSRLIVSGRIRKVDTIPIVIFVHPNGNDLDKPHRVRLTPKQLSSWDLVLNTTAETVKLRYGGAIRKLYTPDGAEIHDVSDLDNGGSYVAVDQYNKFIQCNYSNRKFYSNLSSPQSEVRSRDTRDSVKSLPVRGSKKYVINSVESSVSDTSHITYQNKPQKKSVFTRNNDDSTFTSKQQTSKTRPKNRIDVNFDQERETVYKSKVKNKDTRGAREIPESRYTKVDYPIDQRQAEEVHTEKIQRFSRYDKNTKNNSKPTKQNNHRNRKTQEEAAALIQSTYRGYRNKKSRESQDSYNGMSYNNQRDRRSTQKANQYSSYKDINDDRNVNGYSNADGGKKGYQKSLNYQSSDFPVNNRKVGNKNARETNNYDRPKAGRKSPEYSKQYGVSNGYDRREQEYKHEGSKYSQNRSGNFGNNNASSDKIKTNNTRGNYNKVSMRNGTDNYRDDDDKISNNYDNRIIKNDKFIHSREMAEDFYYEPKESIKNKKEDKKTFNSSDRNQVNSNSFRHSREMAEEFNYDVERDDRSLYNNYERNKKANENFVDSREFNSDRNLFDNNRSKRNSEFSSDDRDDFGKTYRGSKELYDPSDQYGDYKKERTPQYGKTSFNTPSVIEEEYIDNDKEERNGVGISVSDYDARRGKEPSRFADGYDYDEQAYDRDDDNERWAALPESVEDSRFSYGTNRRSNYDTGYFSYSNSAFD